MVVCDLCGEPPVAETYEHDHQLCRRNTQCSSPARHCASHHTDPVWRAAGEEVATACSKYEDYIYRSKGIHAKLKEVVARLQKAEQAQHMDVRSGAWAVGVAPPSRVAAAAPLSDGAGRAISTQQQLRLAELLVHAFERRGVGVEDGVSHLIASHASAMNDPEWEKVREWTQEERRVAGIMRGVVADASTAPVLPLASVAWQGEGGLSFGSVLPPSTSPPSQPSPSPSSPPPSACSAPSALPPAGLTFNTTATANDSGVNSDAGSSTNTPPWQHDPMVYALTHRSSSHNTASHPSQHPPHLETFGQESSKGKEEQEGACVEAVMPLVGAVGDALQGCVAATSWEDFLVLDRSCVARVLTHHPDPGLRAAVYREGVETRQKALLRLLGRQAKLR